MPSTPIFVSRLVKLHLLDRDGAPIGRIKDVVIMPPGRTDPRVLGFVVNVQRRNIFVNAARIAEIGPAGMRLRSGSIDVRAFRKRSGERLASEDLIGMAVAGEHITDVALEEDSEHRVWRVTLVAVAGRGPLFRRRVPTLSPWASVSGSFESNPETEQVAEFREMHPSDVAEHLRKLPLVHRRKLAEMMDDDRLADLLEELDEVDQVRLIEGLDLERIASVLEEMEPDDAADLLGELPELERARLLAAMEPEDSTSLRRLLAYGDDTAGGLMTPEPVIMRHDATVAEALATIRQAAIPAAMAAQVFVVRPPISTPTGKFLGTAPVQRLLREPPATRLEDCVFDDPQPIDPDQTGREVAERLASYDSLAIPVCDKAGRLIGAVTVDDVLDHVLPEGWRQGRRR